MSQTQDSKTAMGRQQRVAWLPMSVLTLVLTLVAVLMLGLTQPVLAQDPGGPDRGMDAGGGPGLGADGGDVTTSTLSDPATDDRSDDPGASARTSAPDDAGAADAAAPAADDSAPDPAVAPDPASEDGQIGLILAPDGARGLPAELMPPADLAGPGIASFAEVQAPRMLGPVDHPPVVVELFTAQGCSSCPPADEMLGDIADRDDILALSWHIDYWDYLGWADPFARPEFTRRQQAYAHQSGERAIYTPQMIVGGTDTLIALRPAELMGMVQGQMARPPRVMVSASAEAGGYRIALTPRGQIRDRVAIILVRYAPSRMVTIKAGENRGIALNYRNVVLQAERVAEWDGRAPLRLTVKPDPQGRGDAFPADTRHVILAQELGDGDPRSASGPILAAIRLD